MTRWFCMVHRGGIYHLATRWWSISPWSGCGVGGGFEDAPSGGVSSTRFPPTDKVPDFRIFQKTVRSIVDLVSKLIGVPRIVRKKESAFFAVIRFQAIALLYTLRLAFCRQILLGTWPCLHKNAQTCRFFWFTSQPLLVLHQHVSP